MIQSLGRGVESSVPCFRIKDLGSTNGTKINKNKIAEGVWMEGNVGDIIRVGSTNMQVVKESLDDGPKKENPIKQGRRGKYKK